MHHGGLVAVDHLGLTVARGELVGLIGPNGAGKTTTVDAISGFTPHTGSVVLDGIDLSGAAAHERARAGLARTWQSVELFEDLTVRQHCEVAAHRSGLGGLLRDVLRPRRHRVDDAVVEALEVFDLVRRGRRAADGVAPRHPEAGRRGPCPGRRAPRCCCSTSRLPVSIRRRACEFGRRLRTARRRRPVRACSSTTTPSSSWTCATGSYVLDFGVPHLPPAHPTRSATIPG